MLYHNQDYIYFTKSMLYLHEIHVVSQPRLHIYFTKSMLYDNHGFREVYMYHNQDYIYTSRNPCCMTTKITYILHEIHVV